MRCELRQKRDGLSPENRRSEYKLGTHNVSYNLSFASLQLVFAKYRDCAEYIVSYFR